ncbi:MAG: hypothetical protein JSW37_01035 [Anaerolineales bacterium]|nr:MAG: hypothetical protein JSW37_01035 [Anaerolineales bacterium]
MATRPPVSDELRYRMGPACEMMQELLLPDEERLPLCSDCDDWDKIPAAMAACAFTVLHLIQRDDAAAAVHLIRTMAESLYTLGYRRGQREARQRLQFTLAEDTA